MKLAYWLMLSSILLAACSTTPNTKTDTTAPLTAEKTNKTEKKMSHKHPKKGVCADEKAPPLNKCANTVTTTFDSKGTAWIVWTNNNSIYVQSSSDKGKTFANPVLVTTEKEKVAAENESRPKIKVDTKGNIYLTWVIMLDEKRSSYVRFSRSTDGGKRFSQPITVNDNLDVIRHRFDSLALGKNGELFIAWLDARETEAAKKAGKESKGLTLYYTTSKDGGEHFAPNKALAQHACECCRLDTTIAPDNTPVIAWRHIFEGGIRDHAIIKFKDWKTPQDPVRLSKEQWKIDACPHHGPAVSISDKGIYHAVWFSGAPKMNGLFYDFSMDGKEFFSPINFAKEGASHPHVLAVGKQVFVTWQHFNGHKNRVYVMSSTNEGKSFAKPVVMAESIEMVDEPFLVTDGKNTYLSWHIEQQDHQLLPVH